MYAKGILRMMKFRHLFENPALAEMLLKNWEYDPSALDLLQRFRISANAIYPFKQDGRLCFLRCCPISEKTRADISAELDFIAYLRGRGFNALEVLPSRSGERLLCKSTPWGEYFASAFARVSGRAIDETDFSDEIMAAYGAALGELHRLSAGYQAPGCRRGTDADVLDWIEKTLRELGLPGAPLAEVNLLQEYFASLPKNRATYGLIHYDFEPDNVFYDEQTQSCSAIDFDDAMYHWYVMDIVQALDNVQSEVSAGEFPHKKEVFLAGYRSKFATDEVMLAAMPVFRRFASLYSYTRVARAMQEHWENEPEWMGSLRAKLDASQARAAQHFGKILLTS
jgi:Ser/Thr protein kinase RdoA (MazF antagonist)